MHSRTLRSAALLVCAAALATAGSAGPAGAAGRPTLRVSCEDDGFYSGVCDAWLDGSTDVLYDFVWSAGYNVNYDPTNDTYQEAVSCVNHSLSGMTIDVKAHDNSGNVFSAAGGMPCASYPQ